MSSSWISHIKHIFNDTGFSYIWLLQDPNDSITAQIKQNLQEQYKQEWHNSTNIMSKCTLYRCYKVKFELEKYLLKLSPYFRKIICKFRTSNHKLPIETGRYSNTPRAERYCTMCNLDKMGDEFHFLLECPALADIRLRLLPNYCHRPNFFKFNNLMSTHSISLSKQLARYIQQSCERFNLYI